MSEIIHPGAGLLYMKVGTHAREGLEEIIARKRKEIDDAGFAMWGYGGNTCHPRSMVQPFAKSIAEKGQPIHLVMHEMNSRHYAEQVRAERYSIDGTKWETIPKAINVLGSRFALMIKDLREHEDELDLAATRVGVGRNEGRLGSRYVQGQADKACLLVTEPELVNEERRPVKIDLVAELVDPYAVFLSEK
ncbi:MAG: hypothetical protein DI637_01750 [Citromicrobium sp.]|uniref:Uncharacterized protein n=1 Tax=Aurantiacibacter spongiae TaxID=2488860 RepID=A0A3N5DK52_9SPHN|nr:hypothetical protein [Aurantiacibacter spongiae]MAM40599.1 hypothetical protein [Erythrobacter sp.]PZT91743.1 MAG: hypothetical protein DI637_01750 [Citromicrobium sp.]RPF71125.1 hypothetical protein EG799_05490 [Aurantiacibacter spongiae]|tara:strand:- start:1707 stop:2279 length:573 start_codon:yes stop_codon:yes gene_type:complete